MQPLRLSIAIPTAGSCRIGFACSLTRMVARLSTAGVLTRPEAQLQISLDVEESGVIHTNREKLVAKALAADMTHIMFLDDDMLFEPEIAELLLGRRQPIVCVNYLIKTNAPQFVAVGLDGQRVPTLEHSTGLLPIAYSGFGVSVFDLAVFRATPQPWFHSKFLPEHNGYTTEDLPAYERLRASGHTVYLDHDASKLVEHVGTRSWHWKEHTP